MQKAKMSEKNKWEQNQKKAHGRSPDSLTGFYKIRHVHCAKACKLNLA